MPTSTCGVPRISIRPQTRTLGLWTNPDTRPSRAIARQRDIIAQLRSGGLMSANAEGILRVLEQTQAAHIADRDMLVKRLCVTSPLASTLSVFLAR